MKNKLQSVPLLTSYIVSLVLFFTGTVSTSKAQPLPYNRNETIYYKIYFSEYIPGQRFTIGINSDTVIHSPTFNECIPGWYNYYANIREWLDLSIERRTLFHNIDFADPIQCDDIEPHCYNLRIIRGYWFDYYAAPNMPYVYPEEDGNGEVGKVGYGMNGIVRLVFQYLLDFSALQASSKVYENETVSVNLTNVRAGTYYLDAIVKIGNTYSIKKISSNFTTTGGNLTLVSNPIQSDWLKEANSLHVIATRVGHHLDNPINYSGSIKRIVVSGTDVLIPVVLDSKVCENNTFTTIVDSAPAGNYQMAIVDSITANTVLGTISASINLASTGQLSITSNQLNAAAFPGGVLPKRFSYRLLKDGVLYSSFKEKSVSIVANENLQIATTAIINTISCGSAATIQTTTSKNGLVYYLEEEATGKRISAFNNSLGNALSIATKPLNKTTTVQLKAEKQLKALNFDGINDSVTVNNLSLNNNSGTWEAWVQKKYWQHNNDALLGNGIGLDMAGSFYISLHNVVGLHCRYGGINQPNNVYAATPLTFNFTNNSWHHFAFTWQRVVDSTILKLYVDGFLVNRIATPLLLNMGNNFLIGGAQNGSANFGEGAMKEIRFWNTAKTDAEIALNQLVGLEGTETGLLAYYRMNETSGSIAADASPNNKNATLINFNASTAWLGDTTAICFGNTTIMQQKQIISNVDSGVAIVATHKTSDTLFRIQYNNANTPISYSVRATGSNILPNFINVPTTAYTSAFINVPFIGTGNYGIYDFELTMQFAGGCEINYPFKLTLIDSVAKERRGNALSLNGISQCVSVPDNDSSLSSYTLESWVYWSPANTNDVQFLFAKAYEQMEVHFGGIGNNGIRFIPTNGVFIDAYNAMPTNQWVHLAVVYNIVGSLAKIYVNGIEVASSAVSSLNPNSTNDFRIGIRGDGTYAFKGMIDEFRVWNYARTATEIRETMHLTLPNGAIGLVQYFQFNESEAYTLALENIGYKHANMIGASRASSGANVSNGISFTLNSPVAATNYVCTGTGVELNFGTAPNGNIVVSKLDGTPPGTQVASNNPFSKAYWIVNNFGTTTTGLNVTAKVGLNSGQLIYADQLNPASIQFNQRKNNTLGAWNKTKNATTVNSSANELIVQEIDSLTEFAFSRFLLNTWSLNPTNSNWHNAANWSNEAIPVGTDSVTILAESNIMPVIDNTVTIDKLNNQGTITVNNANTLTITSNINGNGTIASPNGRITFTGTTSQNIANKINTKDVTVNNAAGVTILDTVKISGVLTPTSGTLYTNGKLVLQSNSISTARIAAGTGNYIDGAVTVERYIPAGNRAFRFLASPVTTTNFIRGNWQEGVNNTSIDYANNQNPVASYGMHITGSTTGLNGFDATQTGAASMFTFNNNTQSWTSIANTNATNLIAGNAYRVLVRGNRSNNLNLQENTINATTLRARGTLLTGDVTYSSNNSTPANLPNLSANESAFSLVANPYASPIDWASLNRTELTGFYYIWDPSIGSRGAYVSCNTAGIKSNGSSNITTAIQSGQAFFVQNSANTATRSLQIQEAHKTDGNTAVFRTQNTTASLSIQLYLSQNLASNSSQDGAVVLFDPSFSNAVNDEDAAKFTNQDENLAIQRGNKNISLESRNLPTTSNDTIQLRLWQLKPTNYTFKIEGNHFTTPLHAFLRDSYLNTETPIDVNGTTTIHFTTTNNAATIAANRFSIVFQKNHTLPVTITNIRGYTKNTGIQVEWNTQNEENVASYEIEKSEDGLSFTKVGTVAAAQTTSYTWFDANAIKGSNYYRLKAVDKSGSYQYTSIINVKIGTIKNNITVVINPIKNNKIQLQFSDVAKDNYVVSVYNNLGQKLATKTIQHKGGSSTEFINLNAVAKGIYQIIILGNNVQHQQIIILE